MREHAPERTYRAALLLLYIAGAVVVLLRPELLFDRSISMPMYP